MKRHVLGILLLMLTSGLYSDGAVLDQISQLRSSEGLSILSWERILEETAKSYAEALMIRNKLTHRLNNETALERYHAMGGTPAVVGEILGCGRDIEGVVEAWMNSPAHRHVLLNPGWTHAGAGTADYKGRKIWVVMFTVHRIKDLSFTVKNGGMAVSGKICNPGKLKPVLLSGINPLEPIEWNRQTGSFLFFIPGSAFRTYHRLGIMGADGCLKVTDVFYPCKLTLSQEPVHR